VPLPLASQEPTVEDVERAVRDQQWHTEDIEDFIRQHREHGQLVGDASEPTLTGYT
jgi:hypothetical protein